MTVYDDPSFICFDCGSKYGRRNCGEATWHNDTCDICDTYGPVTEPRDFGYLKFNWKELYNDRRM